MSASAYAGGVKTIDGRVLSDLALVKAELKKPGPMVVLYSETWCGACFLFHPTYEQLAAAMPNVRFYVLSNLKLEEHAEMCENHTEDDFCWIPTAVAGNTEDQVRHRPCLILNSSDRSFDAVKQRILACLKLK